MVWLTDERRLVSNLRHAASRIWTCAEPEFRLCWMKLSSSDSHYTTAPLNMLNMYVFNLITFTKLCSLLATFFSTQQTLRRCLKIVVRVIWRRDFGQCQINVEIYNVEQRRINIVYFNVDINNVETMLLFWASSFTTLINVETKFWIWSFSKSWKEQKNIFELQKNEDSLINKTYCRSRSIKKKVKYGTYNVEINIGK